VGAEENHDISVRVVDDATEIRTEHLQNTSNEHYRCAKPLCVHVIEASGNLLPCVFRLYKPNVGLNPITMAERSKA
jgi:hypothetical protein